LRPIRTFPPQPGDGIQIWPPGINIIGNKPIERTIITGPRGGQIIIYGPSYGISAFPPKIVAGPFGAGVIGPGKKFVFKIQPGVTISPGGIKPEIGGSVTWYPNGKP
jgi:hypothetical protein